MKKNILILNDWHVGSPYGLQHPNFVNQDGQHIELNEAQLKLWDNFEERLNCIADDHRIDAIQYLGDIIDGLPAGKNDIDESCLPRVEDQIACANMILDEQIRARFPEAIWLPFCYGTKNHEQPKHTHRLAVNFVNLKRYPKHSKMTGRVRFGKALVRFHHQAGFSSSPTGRTGSLEKEIVKGLLASAEGYDEKYHADVRAHVHYHAAVCVRKVLLVTAPSLQLQNLYGTKPTPNQYPDLGFLVLHVNDELIAHGQNPVGFTTYQFQHPVAKIDSPFAEEVDDVVFA